jgi:hypothetical protein
MESSSAACFAAPWSAAATRPVRCGRSSGGRKPVELTAEEAVLAFQRAAQLAGWDDHGEHPLFVYPLVDG